MTTFLDEIIKYETVANNGIAFASNRFDNVFQPMVVESTAFYESDAELCQTGNRKNQCCNPQ